MDKGSDASGLFTWMQLGRLVRCSERATLTQLPHMSYCGLRAPTTPAVTAPAVIPSATADVHRYRKSHE